LGGRDGRRPTHGQIGVVFSLRGTVRSEANAAREFFDELTTLAEKELKRSGEFVLPGMVKLVVQKRKARMGRNPATAKPSRSREDCRQGAHRKAAEETPFFRRR
jgi:nucleoid DNA-binding protein